MKINFTYTLIYILAFNHFGEFRINFLRNQIDKVFDFSQQQFPH